MRYKSPNNLAWTALSSLKMLSFLALFFLNVTSGSANKIGEDFKQKKLSPTLKQLHLSYPDCTSVDNNAIGSSLRFFSYQLGKQTELYGLLCDSSPVNTSFALYMVRDENFHNVERLYFPTFSKNLGWGGKNTLHNASYDPDQKILKSQTYFDSSQNCGTISRYKWTGKGFRLLQYRLRERCNTETTKSWPIVYLYGKKSKNRQYSKRRFRKRRPHSKSYRSRARRLARRKRRQRLRRREYYRCLRQVRRDRYRRRRARKRRRLRQRRRKFRYQRRYY